MKVNTHVKNWKLKASPQAPMLRLQFDGGSGASQSQDAGYS